MTPRQVYNLSKMVNGVSATLFIVVLALSIGLGIILDETVGAADWLVTLVIVLGSLIALYFMFALKVANQWEKAIVLRFGKFRSLQGPGPFWIIPIVDSIPAWIDHRVMVTPFNAEKTLTKEALEVEDYRVAISWAAQTALREIIGQMDLAAILVGRAAMDAELQKIIDERTTPWGVTVQSVEIRDVVIPEALEDAMSRQAQAERERQARVILGESEMQIADSFRQASQAYVDNPVALHLRAMNMLFEGLQERGALVIVPSSAVDTMNLGGLSGVTALAGMAPQSAPQRGSDRP
jgi:regulator of protease activity HflC (stomatin/prohibitin superfamily)